jgi:diadenosine tetraphosphate (Ap4A) HIT family hydrolase
MNSANDDDSCGTSTDVTTFPKNTVAVSIRSTLVDNEDDDNDNDGECNHSTSITTAGVRAIPRTTTTGEPFGRYFITEECIFYRTSFSYAFVNLRPIVPSHVLVAPIVDVVPSISQNANTSVTNKQSPPQQLQDLSDMQYDDLWRTVRVVQRILQQHHQDNNHNKVKANQVAAAATTTRRNQSDETLPTTTTIVVDTNNNSYTNNNQSVVVAADKNDIPDTQGRVSLSFNVAVQDGIAAGQSVAHVHVHILPRIQYDFKRNDEVYEHLERWDPQLHNFCPSECCRRGCSNAECSSPCKQNDLPCNNNEHTPTTTATALLQVPSDQERKDRTMNEMIMEAEMYRTIVQQLNI